MKKVARAADIVFFVFFGSVFLCITYFFKSNRNVQRDAFRRACGQKSPGVFKQPRAGDPCVRRRGPRGVRQVLLKAAAIQSHFLRAVHSSRPRSSNSTPRYFTLLCEAAATINVRILLEGEEKQAKVHVYSLTLIFNLWSKLHYRNGTFQEDMKKNLRDVAIPGTGLPLSVIARSKVLTLLLIIFVYPLICAVRGVCEWDARAFRQQLLLQDWFSFWRLNCRLASLHASCTGEKDYDLEDKLLFLERAEAAGVPVSPYFKKPSKFICKHRNEEGGLGLKSFTNAATGGDWIIQEALANDKRVLGPMLPPNAPLSTFRVVSALGVA